MQSIQYPSLPAPDVPAANRAILSDDIYRTLKERILLWEYPLGHRLQEEDLSREFGVSRMPVREALQRLEREQMVEKQPHRGCTVRQPDVRYIQDLYEVRLALELFVVGQLAEKGMAPDALAALSAEWSTGIQAEMRERFGPAATLDGHIMAVRDETFHEQLAAATGNRLLLEQLQGTNERLHFLRAMDITTHERLAATCADHGAILHAVSRRDGEGARLALRRNVQQGRDQVEAALRSAVARAYVRGK